MNKESLTEAARVVPPVGVTGLTLWGLPVQEWVYVATLVYTVFLIIEKAPKVLASIKEWFK